MVRNALLKSGKLLLVIFLVYLLYVFITAILSAAFPKAVSAKQKELLEPTFCYGDEAPGADRVGLIETTTDALNVRIELIRAAQESLDIVYHNISDDTTTAVFFGEVLKAADRGVQVRFVLDAKVGGLGSASQALLNILDKHENISYRGYNPLHFGKPWTWQYVLHDKFIVSDSKYALLGGRNIGDRYFMPSDYHGEVVNDRDILVWHQDKSKQSGIAQIESYMEQIWQASTPVISERKKEQPGLKASLIAAADIFPSTDAKFYQKTLLDYLAETVPTAKVSLLHNPIDLARREPWLGYQLQRLTELAEHSVLIQTPYATANKNLLAAMTTAADRLDSAMLTNSLASSPNFPAFSNYYAQRKKFLRTGFEIYELQSAQSIHAKSMLIDDRIGIVGSFNMDDRSMYLSTETMLVVDSPEFAQLLQNAMASYMEQCLVVGEDNHYLPSDTVEEIPAPFWKRMLMWLSSLYSRLLQFMV